MILVSSPDAGASEVACAALLWDRLLTSERATMPFYAEFAALVPARPHADETRQAVTSAVQPAGPVQQPDKLYCRHLNWAIGHLRMAACILLPQRFKTGNINSVASPA